MTEQVIDPAKPILTFKDEVLIVQGHRQTYEQPDEIAFEILEKALYDEGRGPPRAPSGDPKDTNLLSFQQLSLLDLQRFLSFCGPVNGPDESVVYNERTGASILRVTDAYLRQICLFINSHSPIRNTRDDYPTVAYLPHNFWAPPTNPPTEEYIEDRAKFIRTKARLPPQRLRALTHLFIHITPFPTNLAVKPDSALLVVTPRAATIEYFDYMDHPDKHYIIGDIMNVISRVDPDRDSTWLEFADWKCRTGENWGAYDVSDRPPVRLRGSQIHVCTDALGQAFGHNVRMDYPMAPGELMNFYGKVYDFVNWRKAMIIAIDLYLGYFSNVITDRQFKPRVKRIFGHRPYKEGDNQPWIDDTRQRRGVLDAQWNASNIWRGLDEMELIEKARIREGNPNRLGRYDDMPTGAELGEFGKEMKGRRTRRLRRWLEDRDADEGHRVTRYHKDTETIGWVIGGGL
ncbi:uncharacterized protein Bfra_007559 [Botrytis fragariae]|uniref:Uncharacterized protein n=1 Tax=Botrytis fragariae TaxID=1964551 RepID=A0A8H6AIP5_9HELO|nr:uncharacterized protein Bfra_007559 [Botrytis fragariae]KAF5868361.1 hypothetical protein Bfra_007559 [Botrytis fragariae]